MWGEEGGEGKEEEREREKARSSARPMSPIRGPLSFFPSPHRVAFSL